MRRWRSLALVAVAALCLTVLSGSAGAVGSAGVGPVYVSGIGIAVQPPPGLLSQGSSVWEGSTLTALPGTWTGTGTIGFSYACPRDLGALCEGRVRPHVHGHGLGRRLVPSDRERHRSAADAGRMVADPTVNGKLVKHAESFKAGKARLTFVVPRTAKGKLLKIKLRISASGQTTTRLYTYNVR